MHQFINVPYSEKLNSMIGKNAFGIIPYTAPVTNKTYYRIGGFIIDRIEFDKYSVRLSVSGNMDWGGGHTMNSKTYAYLNNNIEMLDNSVFENKYDLFMICESNNIYEFLDVIIAKMMRFILYAFECDYEKTCYVSRYIPLIKKTILDTLGKCNIEQSESAFLDFNKKILQKINYGLKGFYLL